MYEMNPSYRRGVVNDGRYVDGYGDNIRTEGQHRSPSREELSSAGGSAPAPHFPTNHHQQLQQSFPVVDNRRRQILNAVGAEASTKNNSKNMRRSIHTARFVTDIILFSLGWIPVILLQVIAKPFERGFYCDDVSIRFPYKDNTVTEVALYVGGAAIVIISVIIVEALIVFKLERDEQTVYAIGGKPIHPFLSSLYVYLGYCAVGVIFVQIATDVSKNMVGRLRPHFISVCDPDWTKINCTSYQFIPQPFCRGTNAKLLKDSRVSFLSGHASYSAYMMCYLIFYIEARLSRNSGSLVFKIFLQFGYAMVALFVGLSRISDYKHHWSDVLAGFALGIFIASLNAIHIAALFRRQNSNYRNRENNLTARNEFVESERLDHDAAYPLYGSSSRYGVNDNNKHIF